jgi:hypothetical protein
MLKRDGFLICILKQYILLTGCMFQPPTDGPYVAILNHFVAIFKSYVSIVQHVTEQSEFYVATLYLCHVNLSDSLLWFSHHTTYLAFHCQNS